MVLVRKMIFITVLYSEAKFQNRSKYRVTNTNT
jgi:hypothetical protein